MMAARAPYATTYAPNGMVCSVDHLASAAGVEVLRNGGNAVDAAIATSAVLAVTTQHMCGMGGDLFALVHTDAAAAPAVLNSSGRAGSGADPDRLRAAGHKSMPFHGSISAVPVPGCVDGWVALHDRFGRVPLTDLLAPAVAYAEDGFPASDLLARSVRGVIDLPDAADYREAGPIRPGTLIRRAGAGRALRAIADAGRDGFYGGEFGQGFLALGEGEHTQDDLDRVQAEWVEPLTVSAFGRTLWTVPPNSQGYLTLAGAWIADDLPLPGDPEDPAWAHLLIEAARQAGHDRPAVLHEHADGAALLSPERLGPRREAIDADRASVLGGTYAGGGTIYLCAVDRDRMGVSLIQSNAAGFGSHLIEPNTRIFLQNRGVGFSLEPGHPAEYGPGRRPPHTLSPALVTDRGALDMVIGTMGGDSQPQVLLQLLARILHSSQSVGDAMAAPRWVLASPVEGATGFDTWNAAGEVLVQLEPDGAKTWSGGLQARGHHTGAGRNFGHAHVIRIDQAAGVLAGAADPRALNGSAAGW